MQRSAQVAVGLILAFLVLSVASLREIPFMPPWGADLQNLHAFHHCAARDTPYLSTGVSCGDEWGRDMAYPPLLYWSFAWIRALSFPIAIALWAVGTVLTMLFVAGAWLPPDSRRAAEYFWPLLLAQYPMLFALERGNNDVLVVLAWSLAYSLYSRGRTLASGLVAGVSVALKLYPVVAVAVVAAGIVSFDRPGQRRLLRFAAGATAAAVAGVVLVPGAQTYLTDVLPRFAGSEPVAATYSHAVVSGYPRLGLAISACLIALWMLVGARRLASDSTLVFAGALAISTYLARTTHDYNLITVYPLLLLLFVRSRERPFGRTWLLLALGLVAIVGDRAAFDGPVAMHLRVLLQVAWLALCGLAFLAPAGSGRGTPPSV